MPLKALPVKVPEALYKRIENLAKKTHRTKTFYVREALISYLEDLEDTYLALERLKKPSRNYSLEEVVKELGLNDEEQKEIGLED